MLIVCNKAVFLLKPGFPFLLKAAKNKYIQPIYDTHTYVYRQIISAIGKYLHHKIYRVFFSLLLLLSSSDLAVPTPPHPALLQAAPVIGSSFAQGVSLIGSNNSQGLIGSSVTQETSLIGSNLIPVMSVIGPNAPMGTSVIGSNLTPGTFAIRSNVTTIRPVIGSNISWAKSAIGSNVPAETPAISSSLPQGKSLILTQGSGGMFFLSTAHGQIPTSASKQPFLFTTQVL